MDLQKNTKYDIRFSILSFALPVMLVTLGYLFLGIYPFGDNTILAMDLHGQYFPMINNLKNAMKEGNLLYSFSSGLGFNLLSQSAYYTNSIFWYFIALLPAKAMIPAFQFVVAFKFGLAGLTFSYFLRRKYGEQSILGVAVSTAYSLSGYTLAYLSQIMWTDAVIILPMVIIGLEIMLEEKRPLVYFISLTALLLSSFYIGFSVCIFTALYFFVYEFQDKRSLKQHFLRTCRFSLYSVLSGAASSLLLIPTFLTIRQTKASSLGFEGELEIYHKAEELLEKFLPFSGNDLEYGPANIYCGAFVLICVSLYIFNNSVSIRKRVLHILLLGFILISFELNLLDFIWHGFHYPNQLPARFSFVFIFLALIISYEAISDLDNIKPPFVISAIALPIILLLHFISTKSEENNSNILLVGLVLVITYSLIFALTRKNGAQFAAMCAALVIVFEVGTNALYIISNETRVYSNNYYTFHYDEMQELTDKYESKKDEFWRSESTPHLSFNSGQLFNHKGLSYYSSMMSGAAYDFFGKLGFGVYAKNVSTIYSPTPVVNSMLGLKYVYDRYENAAICTLETKETVASTTVRENKYFLPLAFMTDTKMAEFDSGEYSSSFEFQNAFFAATGAVDSDVFKKVEYSAHTSNATISKASDNNMYYRRIDTGESVIFSFDCRTDSNGDYYIESAFKAGTIKLYVNGEYVKDFSTSYHKIHFLGNYPEGTRLKVVVTANYNYALYGIDFYKFDEKLFKEGYERLLPGSSNITSATPTKITATVTASKSGLLYTSLPYDGGWRLYVDGKKAEIITVADFLCAAELESGEHTLEFKYSPPGFYIGMFISIFGISSVVAIEILKKKKII